MVMNVTSLTGNGLRDWLVQRASAIILACYSIFLFVYCFMHPGMQYTVWQGLFSHEAMRIFSLLALIALIVHTWIGMWTISTDYLKSASVRLIFQIIVILILLACFIWGIQIFWGV